MIILPYQCFFELMKRTWTQRRSVQAHGTPRKKMNSAKEATRIGAGRKVIRDNKGNGSSWSSRIEENAVEGRPEGTKKVGKGG